jgi:hypothetical protein
MNLAKSSYEDYASKGRDRDEMHETSILKKIKSVTTSIYFEHENDPSVSIEENEIFGTSVIIRS